MKLRNRIFTALSAAALISGAGMSPALANTDDLTPAVPAVTELHPADPSNYAIGGMPAAQDITAVYVHEFNAAEPNTGPVNKDTVHLDSVINAFTQDTGRPATAHFGVEGTRVVQFVSLANTAWAQGPGNHDGWSIETYGGQDPVTKATVVKLIRQLQDVKGGELEIRDHESVMATLCGTHIDPAEYNALVDAPPRQPSTVPDWPWITME